MTSASLYAPSRLQHLDALRGIAIIAVIITHACAAMGPITGAWGVDFANGVQLFYMLSAYTLFFIYNSGHRVEKHKTRDFYLRRFFRIAPLFYLLLAVYAIGYATFQPEHSPSAFHLISAALFINGAFPAYLNSIIGVEWSIAIEMTFYLVAPLLFRWVTSAERAFALVVISLVVAEYTNIWLSRHPEFYSAEPAFPIFWFPAQMPAFAIGIFAYFISQTRLSRRSALLLLAASCTWVAMVYGGGNVRFIPHRELMSLGFGGVLIALSSFAFRPFVNRLTMHLGKISFSLYLLHGFVMIRLNELLIRPLEVSPWVGALILMVGTALIAAPIANLTYRFIELPGISVGRRLIVRLNTSSSASPDLAVGRGIRP